MKSRYYLYRQGVFHEYEDDADLSECQGFYVLDLGEDRQSPTWGMWLGGRLRELTPDKFPAAFKAHLLILDVP